MAMTSARRFGQILIVAFVALSFAASGLSEAAITIEGVTVTPTEVLRYSKVELVVTLSNVAATKYYDPDPAAGGLDLSATFTGPGGTWNINGFYDGSEWRIRFAPNAVGTWSYAVTARDPSGTSNTAEGSFGCVESSHPGWARIDGHYLRFTEGQVLFAVGHNTGWQLDVEQPTFADMAAKGEDLLSFWMATPWAEPPWGDEWAARAPIENAGQGIGNYNQAACAYIDGVVERAEAAGVYLLPTIWSHGQLRDTGHPWGEGWWFNNAYSSVCSATDFFKTTDGGSDTPQWRRQKNFYRYLIARWGYSRAIAGWVGLCEIEGTSGYVDNKSQAEAWCLAVQSYFRANDKFRASTQVEYPIAFSKSDWQPDSSTWGGPFDLRATDSYSSQTDDTGIAPTIATQTRDMRALGQPCFHAEFGGDAQPAHLHNGIWAGTSAGAAMTPLVWCDGGSFPMLTSAMQDHLQYLSQFAAGIGYLGDPGLGPAPLTYGGKFGGQCRGWGMKLSDRGFVWTQMSPRTFDGKQRLTVSELAPGDYTLTWYDVWTSGENAYDTGTASVGAQGQLTVKIPRLAQHDIACKFERQSGNQPPVASDDTATTPQDTPVTIDVLANDTDPDNDPLTVTSVTQGADGTVVNNGDGTVTYTPNTGFTGADAFTYEISDGNGGTDTATVTVTVGEGPVPSIYGWITQEGGSGIEGITVELEKKRGKKWNSAATTTTNAEGYYEFRELKPGTYRVTPITSGWDYTPDSSTVVIDNADDHEICDFTATRR